MLVLAIATFLSLLFPPRNVIAQEEIRITVPEGVFVLTYLSLGSDRYTGDLALKGYVVNNTSKDWKEVIFEIDLYDIAGNKLKGYDDSFIFAILDIKKGEAKSIEDAMGPYFLGLRGGFVSRYEIRFKTGEYPANYIFAMTKPKYNKDLSFEDDFIKILFSISKRDIEFILLNKTTDPIKIDWNLVSYVDVSQESHQVVHAGVKYIDKNRPQALTIVPPTAKIEDIVFPADYIYYTSGEYGGWRKVPLFPEGPTAELYRKGSFSVFMPLEISGVVKNYLFTFKIEDIEM
jgi:hypothetical protein